MVETTSAHNKIKIHRVQFLPERFVESAFSELILAFYPQGFDVGALISHGLAGSQNYTGLLKN